MLIHDFEDWVEYVPEAFNNRTKQEPMTLEILPMSAGDLKRHKLQDLPKMGMDVKGLAYADQVVSRELKARTRSYTNLRRVIHKASGEQEIVDVMTPHDFEQYAPEELKAEIYQAIVNSSKLEEGLKKSSS